jgi:hypothetical protein
MLMENNHCGLLLGAKEKPGSWLGLEHRNTNRDLTHIYSWSYCSASHVGIQHICSLPGPHPQTRPSNHTTKCAPDYYPKKGSGRIGYLLPSQWYLFVMFHYRLRVEQLIISTYTCKGTYNAPLEVKKKSQV